MRNAYNSATFGGWRTILDSGNWTGIVDGRYVKRTGDSIANRGTSTNTGAYGDSALEIREYNFGGA
mgnify:CR=1 FL=1